MGLLDHMREERQQQFDRINLEYQNNLINSRLQTLFAKNPELREKYDTKIQNTVSDVNSDIRQNDYDTRVKFNELQATQLARQNKRWLGVDGFMSGTADVLLAPFRTTADTFEALEKGSSKVVGGLTNTLTSPIKLVVLAGGMFFLYKSQIE
jgi:hypothetical protein